MSFRAIAAIFVCLAPPLHISCRESDPAGPDDEGGFEIVAGPTVTDADGNVYTSIVIGNQTWTVENLRTTKYNDGTEIPLVTDNSAWSVLTGPGRCWYDNDSSGNHATYGILYNWYAVNTGKLAPAGWRVPTDADWTLLENRLIANGYNYDSTTKGNKIAQSMAAQTDWRSPTEAGTPGNDLGKNNSSGFSALPGGYRYTDGPFGFQSFSGYWWSATEGGASHAWTRYLKYGSEFQFRHYYNKGCGFSVRLLRD